MVKVNKKLQKIIADIKVIDSKVEHKLQKSNECQGIKYRKFKITLLKEIGELNVQRGEKTSELSKIVRDAGYKDVNQFMKAFEKSCRLLEGRSERTLMFYLVSAEKLIAAVGKNVCSITTEDIREYLSNYQIERGVCKASIDNTRRNLSSFFK